MSKEINKQLKNVVEELQQFEKSIKDSSVNVHQRIGAAGERVKAIRNRVEMIFDRKKK